MSLLYNYEKLENGSYSFVSDSNNRYLIFFTECPFTDSDGNNHIIYSLGFTRNEAFDSKPFSIKFDPKIKATILSVIITFFQRNDHKAIFYFCFGEDGFSRHRKIIFNQWCMELPISIEKYNSSIEFENNHIHSSLMIVKDNPLKHLILESFDKFIKEIFN